MSDVQESYPLPTSGEAVACKIALSGTSIANALPVSPGPATGWNWDVTLSLTAAGGHASSVAVTADAVDIDDESVSYAGTYFWSARNAAPQAANAGDVVESYPASTSGVFANVASFNANVAVAATTSTANPPTVYAHKLGEALIEVFVPLGVGSTADASAVAGSGVYALLHVTVVA